MLGECALHNEKAELIDSHIIPKFVFDYFKNSGSKYMRALTNPNIRMQDGKKEFLLSKKAEHKFSIREKWFSEKIFIPFMEGDIKKIEYDENLIYFLISVLWRVLLTQKTNYLKNKLPNNELLLPAENEWRLYLRDNKRPKKFNKIYLFFTDRIDKSSLSLEGQDYYLSRVIDSTIIYNETGSYLAIYCKFLKFIFWGLLKSGNSEYQENLQINFKVGSITIPQIIKDKIFSSFINNRIIEINNMKEINPISEKQHNIIEQELYRDPMKFIASDAGQSIYNDIFNLK